MIFEPAFSRAKKTVRELSLRARLALSRAEPVRAAKTARKERRKLRANALPTLWSRWRALGSKPATQALFFILCFCLLVLAWTGFGGWVKTPWTQGVSAEPLRSFARVACVGLCALPASAILRLWMAWRTRGLMWASLVGPASHKPQLRAEWDRWGSVERAAREAFELGLAARSAAKKTPTRSDAGATSGAQAQHREKPSALAATPGGEKKANPPIKQGARRL